MNAMVKHHATHFTPDDHNTRLLRDAFGRFATGVTIVTAQTVNGPIAITANSFSSVSLDPPLVLWSPDRRSTRFEHFTNARHYAIHVLAEGQDELCFRIAKNAFGLTPTDITVGEHDVPLLKDCLAHFECQRENVFDGGDHAIVLGRVLRASYEKGRAGLGFFGGEIGVFQARDGCRGGGAG